MRCLATVSGMLFSVHNNSLEMKIQSHVRQNISGISRSLQRLSTGKRINSGKDDPAGMIACTMIRGSIAKNKAVLKSNQVESTRLATIESGLSQITALLNQARGYVNSAASTGALTGDQIDSYQMQLDSTIDAIRRITKMTTFQGQSVLEGLEGLLNGTLTVDQSSQALGMPYITSSGKLTTENATGKNAITLGELGDSLMKSLNIADEIQKTNNAEKGNEKDSSALSDFVTPIPGSVDAVEDLSLEVQTALFVDSWITQNYGENLSQEYATQLADSLVQQTLNRFTQSEESSENGIEDIKSSISASLDSVLEELKDSPSPYAESLDPRETLTSDEQAEALLEALAQQEAQELLEEQAKLEEEQRQAEEAQKALDEEARLKEEEERQKALDEQIEAQKQRAHENYFAAVRNSYSPEETPEEEDTQRDRAIDEITSMINGGFDGLYGFGGADVNQLAESGPMFTPTPRLQSEPSEEKECEEKEAEEKPCEKDDEEKKPETTKSGSLDDLRSGGVANLKDAPESADKILKDLIGKIAFSRAVVGVNQKSLDVDNTLLTSQIFHETELDSLLSDTDFAEETSNLMRHQLLLQTSLAALQIVQDFPNMILKMIEAI